MNKKINKRVIYVRINWILFRTRLGRRSLRRGRRWWLWCGRC